MSKATLTLEDGSIFSGTQYGASGLICGEVIFNTSMTGYQEILTDCSYTGQILTLTSPHIGNVGVNKYDMESNKISISGLVVRELSLVTSSWRAEQSLRRYLKKQGTIVISEVDTRELTQRLRKNGTMIGCIASGNFNKKEILSRIKNFDKSVTNIACKISTEVQYLSLSSEKQNFISYRVVVYDFGVKRSILKYLEELGCQITVVPSTTPAKDIVKLKPEGIVLSNGPGNPEAYENLINITNDLVKLKVPLLGICLGYQLLAISCGATTVKMQYGHHGANHPVQDLKTGKVLITSQNHNFAVSELSLPKNLIITHRSLFDGSLQGFQHTYKPIYGFQGHPEAGPGPSDGKKLFDPFISMMRSRRLCQKDQI